MTTGYTAALVLRRAYETSRALASSAAPSHFGGLRGCAFSIATK